MGVLAMGGMLASAVCLAMVTSLRVDDKVLCIALLSKSVCLGVAGSFAGLVLINIVLALYPFCGECLSVR